MAMQHDDIITPRKTRTGQGPHAGYSRAEPRGEAALVGPMVMERSFSGVEFDDKKRSLAGLNQT